MRVTLKIDSATSAELRDLQQAFHGAMRDEPAPSLWDHGTSIAAAVSGPEHWNGATPPVPAIPAARMLRDLADRIERATPATRVERKIGA